MKASMRSCRAAIETLAGAGRGLWQRASPQANVRGGGPRFPLEPVEDGAVMSFRRSRSRIVDR